MFKNPFAIALLALFAFVFVFSTPAFAAGNSIQNATIPPLQNINVTYVNSIQASKTPAANKLLALNANGKFPLSTLPIYGSTWTGSSGQTGFKVVNNYASQAAAIKGAVSSSTDNSYAVFGQTTSSTGKVYGVYGETASSTGAGVLASNDVSGGNAIELAGGIKVVGADTLNSSTSPVFIQVVIGGVGGNFSASGSGTVIDNVFSNGKPNAIIIVTPNYTPQNGSGVSTTQPIGVKYDNTISKWIIFNEDNSGMTIGEAFNVMIIDP